jgi:N-acetylmuramic acid 6-phosphate etherase
MTENGVLPPTEQRNPKTMDLDTLSVEQMLRVMNEEDAAVAPAVAREIPMIAEAVERIAQILRQGGRLIYVGAGTSGRLALLDALECPPTFNTDPQQVQAVVAGGISSDVSSSAEFEDRADLGREAVIERAVGSNDVVVGVAASGTTPFTVAAVEEARRRGAGTVALCCVPGAPLARAAEIAIVPVVGPEVLTGSTRLKAGTAQKLVLNMLSTAAMVRIGKAYGNLMVEVRPGNRKLQARAERILIQAVGVTAEEAQQWLRRAEGNLKVAIVMAASGVDRKAAVRLLAASGGQVRGAIAEAAAQRPGGGP